MFIGIAQMREVQLEFAEKTGGDIEKRDELVTEYLRQSATAKPLSSDVIRSLALVLSVNKLSDVRVSSLSQNLPYKILHTFKMNPPPPPPPSP